MPPTYRCHWARSLPIRCGGPAICVVSPAVFNAIHAATGTPVRSLPLKNLQMVLHRIKMTGSLRQAALAFLFATALVGEALAGCGEVVSVPTDGSTMRLAYIPPAKPGADSVTLLLLAGGPGYLNLDDNGCARLLKGNFLVRSIQDFGREGFGTALVDAPGNYQGEDGLEGYRAARAHADDLGKIIAMLRARTQGKVWVVGTSRGTISAANAAARLSGTAAPDGVILTSALMSGQVGAKKIWVAQTVFDLPLADIRLPLLLLGHAADTCTRSPPGLMDGISTKVSSTRKQQVLISGGPDYRGGAGLAACEGKAPHGYPEQEAEIAAGMARFIRGGRY